MSVSKNQAEYLDLIRQKYVGAVKVTQSPFHLASYHLSFILRASSVIQLVLLH